MMEPKYNTQLYKRITSIFNLQKDADETGTIENIRKNVDFHGANVWTLVFAIFIASIGLNMNSTAVIIGAMLISPLMGPILGLGLALGINDETLLKKSFRNLVIAVLISICTSTIYFFISPIHEAESELLARTYPTFYDILIAFFGGAAGIVSISRKERGPSVAGVAIATALMPPLCTAGFAVATGNFKFLAGALYLFLINSVFIALSTFLFVRYMKFTVVQFEHKEERIKRRRWISVIITALVLPSLFFAWTLLQESRFRLAAERFLREELHSAKIFVVEKNFKYRYSEPIIEVGLVGTPLSNDEIKNITQRLPLYGLAKARLKLRQLRPDEKTATSVADAELAKYEGQLQLKEEQAELLRQLTKESKAFYSEVDQVIDAQEQLGIIWSKKPSKIQMEKLNAFLQARQKSSELHPHHLLQLQNPQPIKK